MNRRAIFVSLTALVVLSVTTGIQAVDYSWEAGTSGNWNSATDWAPDGVPGGGVGDTVTIDAVGGPYVVTLNVNPANPLNSFALDSSGATFSAISRIFTVNGPSDLTDGSVTWQSSTWAGTGTLTNDVTMTIRGSSSVNSGGFVQSGTVLITGGVSGSHATLTSDNGFNNSGTITLDATHAGYRAYLTVNNGTLTNMLSGTINSNETTSGLRTISANLANNGTVNVNTDTTLQKTGGQYTNNGDFNIASGKTLTIIGSSQVFNQSGGTLDIDGTMALTSMAFNYGGGAISGTPTLSNVNLDIGAGAVNPASFLLQGSSTLTGDVYAGQLLNVRGGVSGAHATLTSDNGFNNSGTITLDATHASYRAYLTVNNGTLNNTTSGTINSNGTTSGTRTISANLANNGTVNVNTDTTLQKTGGQYTNSGDFNIAASETLTISGSSQVFNQSGGTLDIDGTMALASMAFNYGGGTISGTPTLSNVNLDIGAGAANPASFLLQGTGNTLTGDVYAGQLLNVRGGVSGAHATLTSDNGFNNSGTITLDATHASYYANLTVTGGTLTNTLSGTINSNGTTSGARTISANLINNGTVNVNTDTTFSKNGGQYTNNGDFNIAAGEKLAILGSSQVFNQSGGTLDIDGTMALTSMAFNYGGGTISGVPTLSNVNLDIDAGATNPASFLLQGASNTLSGDVHAGQLLNVRGGAAGFHAMLTSADGFDNSGTITLDATHASYYSKLTVTSGTLTNTLSGTINSNGTTSGTRTISANLTNNGTVNINTDTTFSKNSAQYTNNGDFNIAAGETLTISGSSQVFNQSGGTLDIDGTMALTGMAFNYGGGTISGTPTLSNVNLDIGAGAANPASFLLQGTGNTLTGDVYAGQLLNVRGSTTGSHATLTSADGFDNSGTIALDATHASYYANLTVTGGTLTNTASGTINSNGTTSGTRTISANLTNNGTVNINTDTTFSKTGAQYINNGDLNIAASETLTVSGSGVNFINGPAGTIAGDGTLNLGTATFANNGRIEPGNSPGILTITGDVPFSDSAELGVEIFGLTVGSEYDRLVVSGQADIDGRLTVDLGSFIPDPSDSFTIMIAGELSGSFDNTPGNVLSLVQGTCDVIYNYDADTVTLTNFQDVPEPTAIGLIVMGGLVILRRRRRC